MHCFILKVLRNCQNQLYDHPITYDQKLQIYGRFNKFTSQRCNTQMFFFFFSIFYTYVDDIFVTFLCQSHLKDFANQMNTKHPNMKFTSEFEENYSCSFLNVKITCPNNQLVTSVFRKATFSGAFTNLKVLCLSHKSLAQFTLYFIAHFPFVLHMKKQCY